jgi:hypothetical protein
MLGFQLMFEQLEKTIANARWVAVCLGALAAFSIGVFVGKLWAGGWSFNLVLKEGRALFILAVAIWCASRATSPLPAKRKLWIAVFGLVIPAVVGSLMPYFNPLHSLALCSERTVMEKASPDGRYVAVLMRRSCGVTMGHAAHINLRLASSAPFPKKSSGGPINDGEIFGTSKYSGERFCWSGPQRLEIDYLAGENLSPGQWMDVTTGGDYSLCDPSR